MCLYCETSLLVFVCRTLGSTSAAGEPPVESSDEHVYAEVIKPKKKKIPILVDKDKRSLGAPSSSNDSEQAPEFWGVDDPPVVKN
jgi:hypothetical protein